MACFAEMSPSKGRGHRGRCGGPKPGCAGGRLSVHRSRASGGGNREEALRAHHQERGVEARAPLPRLHRPPVPGYAARCSTGKATPPKKSEPFFGSPPCRSPRRSAGWGYRWAAPPRKGEEPGPYVAVRKAGRRPGARNQKGGPHRPTSRTAGAAAVVCRALGRAGSPYGEPARRMPGNPLTKRHPMMTVTRSPSCSSIFFILLRGT